VNWTFDVVWDYFLAALRYWWLLVPGVVMPVLDISRAHFRDFRVPRWLTISISLTALVTAQFLAYKDSIKNLSNVIIEKRLADSKGWHLGEELSETARSNVALKAHIADLESKPPRTLVKQAPTQPEPKRCWLANHFGMPNSTIKGAVSATAAIIHCNVKVDAPFQVAVEFDRDFIPGSMVVPGFGGFMGSVVKNGRTFIQSAGYPLLSNQLAIVTVYGETDQYPRAVQASVETLK